MKSCLKDNVIEMYSAQNEGKFAVRTLKNKICKYMTMCLWVNQTVLLIITVIHEEQSK